MHAVCKRRLTQLGLPRDTKGQFPISVDYNAK